MTKKGSKRNKPCWCGSGKKYKYCHLGREDQQPLESWDLADRFNKAFSKKTCLAPSAWQDRCRGGIVKAHTVSRSGSLKRIARNGHVYSCVRNLNSKEISEDMLKPVLRGLKWASTFTGFCAKHDNDIFSPLEDKTFAGRPEQCFLIGYRAIARELYTKMSANWAIPLFREGDRGRSPRDQGRLQSDIQQYENGIQTAIRDFRHYKALYDSILQSQCFGGIHGYVIEFTTPPPVMCSGAIFPHQDYNGVKLQNFGDLQVILDQLSFASFYGGERGVVAFSWLAEHGRASQAFVESLVAIPDDSITKALLRFFFTYCENIHLAPDWWERQTVQAKDAVIKRIHFYQGITETPLGNVLTGDDELHTSLTVIKRYGINQGQ